MKFAAAILMVLSIPSVAPAAQAHVAGAPAAPAPTPLLEMEAHGYRRTSAVIPTCSGGFCTGLQPRYLAYRVTVMTNGQVAGRLDMTVLDDPMLPRTTMLFRGKPSTDNASILSSLLTAARIGREPGGCSIAFSEAVAAHPYRTQHVYQLAYAVRWFGRGQREHRFELPSGARSCSRSLRQLMRHILFIPPIGPRVHLYAW